VRAGILRRVDSAGQMLIKRERGPMIWTAYLGGCLVVGELGDSDRKNLDGGGVIARSRTMEFPLREKVGRVVSSHRAAKRVDLLVESGVGRATSTRRRL
jgi:hypothetical protein